MPIIDLDGAIICRWEPVKPSDERAEVQAQFNNIQRTLWVNCCPNDVRRRRFHWQPPLVNFNFASNTNWKYYTKRTHSAKEKRRFDEALKGWKESDLCKVIRDFFSPELLEEVLAAIPCKHANCTAQPLINVTVFLPRIQSAFAPERKDKSENGSQQIQPTIFKEHHGYGDRIKVGHGNR